MPRYCKSETDLLVLCRVFTQSKVDLKHISLAQQLDWACIEGFLNDFRGNSVQRSMLRREYVYLRNNSVFHFASIKEDPSNESCTLRD